MGAIFRLGRRILQQWLQQRVLRCKFLQQWLLARSIFEQWLLLSLGFVQQQLILLPDSFIQQ